MKKFTFVFAGLLMAFQSYAANDLIEIKTVKDFQNRKGVAAQPEGVFAISRTSWFTAKKYIDVTPDAEYKVLCFIRSASDAKLRIRLGLSVLGADKKPVFSRVFIDLEYMLSPQTVFLEAPKLRERERRRAKS